MGAPQYIMIGLLGLGIGYSAAKHDEPKTGKHSIGVTLIATVVEMGLLYWGGFFG